MCGEKIRTTMKQKELIQKHIGTGGMPEMDHKDETIIKHLFIYFDFKM